MSPSPDPAATPRSPWRSLVRIAVAALIGAALFEGAWLLFFDWAGSSGRLAGWLNRRPEKVAVAYRSIHSRWPGLIEIEGLDLRGRTTRLDWEVTADRARAQIEILPLLARRLRVRGAELTGVEVRRAKRLAPGEAPAEHTPHLRPLPEAPPRAAGGTASRTGPAAAGGSWTFEFRNLRVAGLREIDLDESALSGAARGELGFVVDSATGEAEIFASTLEVDNVTLTHRGREIGRGLTGKLDLALSPYRYRDERGRALVPHASGAVRLRGEIDDRPILDELLGRVDWVEIDPGVAPLDAELVFRDGRLLAGSRLTAPRSGRQIRFLDFTIEGQNGLSIEVKESARWEIRFERFVLRRGGEPAPFLVGTGLALVGESRIADLAHIASEGKVGLELGDAHLPDLGFLMTWLPPAARIEKIGGGATVKGSFAAGIGDGVPTGSIDVASDDAALRWNGIDFSGKLETKLVVSGGDVRARRLELDGTRLMLKDFAAPQLAAPERAAPVAWWMQLDLVKGRVALGPPLTAGGSFALRMRDTAPILALFETRRDLPKWAERVLEKQDVKATGSFHGAPRDLTLDDLQTELLGGKLSARLHFAGADRTGKLLLAWQRVALGVGFRGSARELRVVKAREWYEEKP